MLKLCYLKIYPAGQKTYSDSQYVCIIIIIIIFFFFFFFFFVFQGSILLKGQGRLK